MAYGWRVRALLALVAASACSDHGAKTEVARKIFTIVDRQFQECIFGAEVPPGDLGRTEVIAQVTGAADAHRVSSCVQVTKTRYEAVQGYDDRELAPLIAPFAMASDPLLHEGFGVCNHLSTLRAAARKLGIDTPEPDCSSHRDPLPGIVEHDPIAEPHVYRDQLALVDGNPARRLHRTQDGVTWDLSPPLLTSRIYITGSDAFAYSYANEKNNARNYVVLDGDKWHVGTAVVGWEVVSFRRTTSGWCIVTIDDATKTPVVLQLDPLMDHITARTALPALRGRWSEHALRAALIDKQGNVNALVAGVGPGSASLESHFVSVAGKLEPPTVTKLEQLSAAAEVYTCRGPTTEYIMVEHIGSLVSTDAGRTFTQLEGGKVGQPVMTDCTDAHLFVATKLDFESCDHRRCSHTPMPLPKSSETKIALNVSGEQPRLLATYNDVAFIATPSVKDGLLEVSHVWRTKDSGIPPIARIDGLWFAPIPTD